MTTATTTDWFFLLLLLLSVAAGQNVNDDDMVVTHVYVWASAAEIVYAYGMCLDVLWKFIAFVSLIRMSAIEHAFWWSEHGTQHTVKKKSYASAPLARMCRYTNIFRVMKIGYGYRATQQYWPLILYTSNSLWLIDRDTRPFRLIRIVHTITHENEEANERRREKNGTKISSHLITVSFALAFLVGIWTWLFHLLFLRKSLCTSVYRLHYLALIASKS